MSSNNPFKDTIWYRCLWELLSDKTVVADTVEFSEVDALVVGYTKLPIGEFWEKFKLHKDSD